MKLSWPVRTNGDDGRWQIGHVSCRALAARGFVKAGRDRGADSGGPVINSVSAAVVRAIDEGRASIASHDPVTGVAELDLHGGVARAAARTIWFRAAHNASVHGTGLLATLLPSRRFPFPKSLYAVEDVLRFYVGNRPDAVVVDFFSGSGTTAHAVMRLNKQDGGRRQCISVTNNEVSADEQKALRKKGLRPGDPEWEALGICDYITKPRIKAAITGLTPNGEPIKGDYKFTDEFPMSDGFEENAEFFTLTYEAPLSVRHGRSFKRIAPLLWLRAGAQGRRIDEQTDDFDIADSYAVLFDLDYTREFIRAMAATTKLRMAFIVTDDDRGFQQVVAELPEGVEPVRLYSSYLTNFSFTGDVE